VLGISNIKHLSIVNGSRACLEEVFRIYFKTTAKSNIAGTVIKK